MICHSLLRNSPATVLVVLWSLAIVGCDSRAGTEPEIADKHVELVSMDTVVYTLPVDYLTRISNAQKHDIYSYDELISIWDSLNYSIDVWESGLREIPRTFVLHVPHAWRAEIAQHLTVQNKKLTFFQAMAPLVLEANELILKDHERLLLLIGKQDSSAFNGEEMIFLSKLARTYKLDWPEGDSRKEMLHTLLKRVEPVPVSLALAQAAIESGWGTSRFADEGNSIFGQWAWSENAIKPKEQRSGMGNYGIAAFSSLQESVSAYMLNINTHRAYKSFREKRWSLKNANQPISGIVLSEQLDKYSERGWEYVEEMKSMIRVNHLAETDRAYLSNDNAIYLNPVHIED